MCPPPGLPPTDPDWRPALRERLAGFALSPAREAEVVLEMAQHLDDRYAELIAGGVPLTEAFERTREELRRMNLPARGFGALRQANTPRPLLPAPHRASLVGGLWHDARQAVRSLARRPTFTLVAIVTLALGIGLNTAMFSFTSTLLLRPLPFPDADRMARIFRITPENGYGDFPLPEYLSLERGQTSFTVAGYRLVDVTLEDPAVGVRWIRASASLFDVLGTRPQIGRVYTADDERAKRRVAVIGYRFWRDRLGGSPDVLGRTVAVDGERYQVIGVLPIAANDHRLFGRVGLFTPLSLGEEAGTTREPARVGVVGRRAPHVTRPSGESVIAALGAAVVRDRGGDPTKAGWRTEELPLSITGPTGRVVAVMLLALSGCVLVIACSNLATVLLSGAIERRRESAVRAAIGASRLQLARPLLLESTLLAAAGGVAGLCAASWASAWLRTSLADAIGFEFPTDWRVAGFAVLAAGLTIASTGLVPSLFAIRVDVIAALKSGARGTTTGRQHQRLKSALIALQLAVATILVTAAGLFLSGTTGLLTEDRGWRSDRILQAQLRLPTDTYDSGARIGAFYREAIARLERIPGVEAASVSYGLPYLGLRGRTVVKTGSAGDVPRTVLLNAVSASYFRVTGTRLIAGRTFSESDRLAGAPVVVVSDSLSRALFANGSALGHRLALASDGAPVWMEVVGTVADTRPVDIAEPPLAFQVYQHVLQDPRPAATIAVRTVSPNPELVAPAMRAAMEQLDPGVTVRDLASADRLVDSIGSQVTLLRRLLAAFAGLGTFLALLGIYGVIARSVAQRTMELGVRMAMGAQVRSLIQLLVTSSMRVAGLGMAIGLAGAAAAAIGFSSVFPGMHVDAVAVVGTAVFLLAGTVLAVCVVSARRVAAIDPVVALRAE
jgi:predicted permease